MTTTATKKPRLPPRWFIRLAWFTHRRVYRLTGGRLGLWRPKPDGWGTMRLTTTGRRTGQKRSVMVGYFEDGPNLITMAMNGWGEGEPAWWLNLQAQPGVQVDLADGPRLVTGRAAQGEERERLWARWREIDKNLDAYASRRSTETAVVILEPRQGDRTDGEEANMADAPNLSTMPRGHRTGHSPGVGVLSALEGAALIAWHLAATPFIGRRRQRWGTVGTEATDSLPGDEFVPETKWSYTLGITVDAPAEAVWPWLAQIGQGRGGFYTYETLENIVGCKIKNTTEILPDHQHPAVGDDIYLHPTGPPLRIEIVDPPKALVLFGSPADVGAEESWGTSSWQLVVNPGPDGGSRLLTRGRYNYSPDWKSRLMFGRFPLGGITFVMSRRMMFEIKRLAEHD